MSIFDLFSSSQGTSGANRAYRDVKGGLTSGFTGAQDFLTKGLGDVTGTLGNYGNQAINALMSGVSGAEGAVQQGIAPWQKLFGQFDPAVKEYFGLLGSGTPEDISSANAAWQSSPFNQALQGDISTGTEDLARKGFGAGQTGKTSQDVMDYISNLTQHSLTGFENLLSPAIQGAQNAAGGIQGGYENLAKLLSSGGAGKADILQSMGKGIAGAQGGVADILASLYDKMKTGVGQAGATKEQQIFGAQQGADTNILNALFGLGGLAMAPFTGGGSLSALFGGGGTGAFDSMMQGSGFMDKAGNIY
jgi:hypothetical protein